MSVKGNGVCWLPRDKVTQPGVCTISFTEPFSCTAQPGPHTAILRTQNILQRTHFLFESCARPFEGFDSVAISDAAVASTRVPQLKKALSSSVPRQTLRRAELQHVARALTKVSDAIPAGADSGQAYLSNCTGMSFSSSKLCERKPYQALSGHTRWASSSARPSALSSSSSVFLKSDTRQDFS